MGRSNRGLDLKLQLSPFGSKAKSSDMGSSTSSDSSEMSIAAGSCVSSESDQESNLEATTSMVLLGCPRCLMYVMSSKVDPKCPSCKKNRLLDVLHLESLNKNIKNRG